MSIKAFLIAVSEYSKIGRKNIPCKNDLFIVQDSLIKGLNVPQKNISLLGTDGVVLKNDVIKMMKQIHDCESEDVLFFYFSGHGGDGNIYFSDSCVGLNSIVDFFKELPQKKILVFDSCYSGNAQINNELDFDNDINLFNDNCVVFASCKPNELSGFNSDRNISLYTSFFCDAITYSPIIKKGKKTIDDIAHLVTFFAKKWEEENGLEQHPVFRSSLPGTLEFRVNDYSPYISGTYHFECEEYCICSVEPTHQSLIKRYSVKVMLNGDKNTNDISRITKEIVEKVKCLRIFSNEISEKRYAHNYENAKIIWCYFGYDDWDICFSNWAFLSTWVDHDQDKSWWYRTNPKSSVVDDILVANENGYSFNRLMRFSTISEDEFVEQTETLFCRIIDKARKFIQIYREIENDTIKESDGRIHLEPISKEIIFLFFKMGNLPASFPEKQQWFYNRYEIASAINDMALFYRGDTYEKWDDKDRQFLVLKAISTFQEKYVALTT